MSSEQMNIDGIWADALRTAGVEGAWELSLNRVVLASHDRTRLFSGASMAKTLLAALIDEDVRSGRIALSRPVQVAPSAVTGEDGLLRFGQIPTMHRLADLILLMIAVSDNTATNTLVDFLGGPAAISARCAARGWSSRVLAPVGAEDGSGFSEVSIADHQDALGSIREPLILAAFAAQQDRRALARLLESYGEFRHKTGTAGRVRHDAGVLMTPRGELWVACFSDGGPVSEYVDHPACVAMGTALRDTLLALGLGELTVTTR